MKIMGLRILSLCLSAGTLGVSLAAVNAPAAAPDIVRAQAREIFAEIVGIESSIGKANEPTPWDSCVDQFSARRVRVMVRAMSRCPD